MDKHPSRRQLRFLRALTARSAPLALGCLALFLPAAAQYNLGGYLAAVYENGQKWGDSPEGSFGKVQAGLMFAGTASNIFAYDLEARFRSENKLELEQAWVAYAPSASFALKLGLYLVPFGKYNTANRPDQNSFIQTPLPQASLYPQSWRDVGLLTEGKWGPIGFSLYLGNGLSEGRDLTDGQQFKDNNGDLAGGGRVALYLSQSLEVGLSYYQGRYDDQGQRNLKLEGADVTWKSQNILITYEYDRADLDNPAGYDRGLADGHFVLANLTIGKFSPLVSYQTLVYKDPYHGEDPLAPGISRDISRWALGLVYSPITQFMFKLEYDFNRESAVQLDNDLFQAQVTFRF
jgi:hypothetical protein